MKKRLLPIIIVAVCAVSVYMGYTTNNPDYLMDDLLLANAEALTDGETGPECRWRRVKDEYGCTYHVCIIGGDGDVCTCGQTRG